MKKQHEKQMNVAVKPTQDNFLQSMLSWVLASGTRLKPFQAILYVFYLGKIPGLRERIPWLNHKKNSFTYLPINTSLENTVNNTMPVKVIHDFIDQASTHVIMDKCGCRMLSDCKNYTHHIGCLFMGDTAQKLPHGVSHYVTRKEAHDHVDNGVRNGLVPLSGKVRIDNFIYMTPDRNRLLSVCFCCPCCCILRSYKHVPGRYLDGIIEPIDGLTIEVSDDCIGCETCMASCPFDAIRIVDGKAIHTSNCRGCGRCETNCPQKAVKLTINNVDFVDTVKNRISSYVDI
jgi:UDP-glucose 4-epimerase